MLYSRSVRNYLLPLILLLSLTSCFRADTSLEPRLELVVKARDLRSLPTPFPALLPGEKRQDWGKEYLVGARFARELDLYRAITSFKRARFLLPKAEKKRGKEIDYQIALCYYLGDRYEEAIDTVQTSALCEITPSFPAYQELLILLSDSYHHTGDEERAAYFDKLLESENPEVAETLSLSQALAHADLPRLKEDLRTAPLVTTYCQCRKSQQTAELLNALLPGAGFWYVGQKQTAITSFLVNGLFLAAAVELFRAHQFAAGVIVTSLEAGWYFGGIYGAGEAAHFYNERLYERHAAPLQRQERLLPAFLLRWAF